MGRIGTPTQTGPFAFVLLTLVRYAVFGVLGTVRSYDRSGLSGGLAVLTQWLHHGGAVTDS
jgi:hypothetical protein